MHAASFNNAEAASASTTTGTREAVAKAERRPIASVVSGSETDNEDTAIERTREEEALRWKMAKTAVRQ